MENDELPLWRRCELAWASYLSASGHLVTFLADAHGRDGENKAPLMQLGDRRYRAPDLDARKAGVSEYWEVKQRNAASVNPVTGVPEYWVSYDAFADYYRIAELSGTKVWIILRDSEVWRSTRRWLQADVADVFQNGERAIRFDGDANEIEAWVWPAEIMRLVQGPEVEGPAYNAPVLVHEGDNAPVSDDIITLAERELRRPRTSRATEVGSVAIPPGVFDILRANSQDALDVRRRALGIPGLPRYSVMRVGLEGQDVDGILGLMEYGIRVFLIGGAEPRWTLDEAWIDACIASRLLEYAVVDGAEENAAWIVDGDIPSAMEKVVARAADDQPYNHKQFMVVHSPISEDILIRAGAGTGKTETMSERIVFLLATSSRHADPRDEDHVFRLHLDEIVLVTFSRDSAREMRERIARTLMLRQRLCTQCVLPTIAWLLELSNTEIETIHTYSKKILQREGSRIGFGPGFSIGELTMEFRRVLDTELSSHLDLLITETTAPQLPASHEFREQASFLWEKLSGNGFSPLAGAFGSPRERVTWGGAPDGIIGQVSEAIRSAIETTAPVFADVCRTRQTIPVSEIISSASRAINAAGKGLKRRPRFLFVDEFQDTDSDQISMLLDLQAKTGARLFVVGDEKQGIYRFRGAQGNAFKEIIKQAEMAGLTFSSAGLTQNFRSGSTLLDSLHPYFTAWGESGFLEYDETKQLTAARGASLSKPINLNKVKSADAPAFVLSIVKSWLEDHTADTDTIAVLCRTNKMALEYSRLLKANGVACEVRGGGDFFRSQVVSDLRVFLEAVLDPSDDAALLELSATRWFPGIASMAPPVELSADDRASWGPSLPAMRTWPERFSTLSPSGWFERSDIEALRNRIIGLARIMTKKPVLGWLMDCDAWIQPRSSLLVGEDQSDSTERLRYGRGFDHLVTLLDETFGDAPVSAHRLLEWLRLKIATDQTEVEIDLDVPDPIIESNGDPGLEHHDLSTRRPRVTVVTVHKAKGLEYARVVIPGTNSKFNQGGHGAEVAIVPDKDGDARLLWNWRPSKGSFTNVHPKDSALWGKENIEKIREEARLLYVAMTRAREELEIVVSPQRTPNSGNPNTWGDLIRMGD